ncbi:amino acid ABC transporter substrate-binding protein [Rugosimonospora acidiphila]|uniref:Amino acid ABC transporter substrate-binding protein n=1 Tax=Rugosimonospora acidiphila TaxID=556531 RepID=A0ABP9RLE5_9ACTN
MKVRTTTVAVTAVLALSLAACGSKGSRSTSGADQDQLTIGVSMSLTGSLAREGLLTRSGYEFCQQVINGKGGIPVGDRKVKLNLVFQDDTSSPDTAAQLIDQYNDKGYKLVLSPYGSAATEAAAAVVERNGQVMVDSLGADDTIFEKGYRRTFGVLSPGSEYAASIVEALHDLAKPTPKTVIFLSADDGFSKSVTTGGEKAARGLGMTVLPTQFFPNGASDVSAALSKAKALHPDVIIGSVHFVEGVAIIKQSKELGVRPQGFGETVAPPTPDFPQTLNELAEGVLGSSQWVSSGKGSDKWFGTSADYATAYKAKFGEDAQYHAASASAACLALVMAVEKAHSLQPDAVRDALASLDTPSFFGPIKFDPTGKNVTKQMSVIQIQHGEAVPVWPADVAQKPLIWPGAA